MLPSFISLVGSVIIVVVGGGGGGVIFNNLIFDPSEDYAFGLEIGTARSLQAAPSEEKRRSFPPLKIKLLCTHSMFATLNNSSTMKVGQLVHDDNNDPYHCRRWL
jgi:hypothetical protein